jgi:hypothetical protein
VELFHTLDHLLSRGKAVVLSADAPPHEIAGLDPNLRSRMSSGLVAYITPPELETRRAILREKAAAGGVRIRSPHPGGVSGDACLPAGPERARSPVRPEPGRRTRIPAATAGDPRTRRRGPQRRRRARATPSQRPSAPSTCPGDPAASTRSSSSWRALTRSASTS